MLTRFGAFADLSPADPATTRMILDADKLQIAEGMVFSHMLNATLSRLRGFDDDARLLDVESALATIENNRHAFVWPHLDGPGLGQYLDSLAAHFTTWLVRLGRDGFVARRRSPGTSSGDFLPVEDLLRDLTDRPPRDFRANAVRDVERRQCSWDYLVGAYGEECWRRVALPRLFMNDCLQPWSSGLADIDRVIKLNRSIWTIETKLKSPIPIDPVLAFGLNDREINDACELVRAGFNCLYLVAVKPLWSDRAGAPHLAGRQLHRDRTLVIGRVLDPDYIAHLLASERYLAGHHTALGGTRQVAYRRMFSTDFVRFGHLDDHDGIAAAMLHLMQNGRGDRVADCELRSLRIEEA